MKQCNKCNEIKPFSEYYKRKDYKDGFLKICKDCHAQKNREWYATNKQKKINYQAQKRIGKRQEARDYAKNYRHQNPEKIKDSHTRWRKNNPEKVREHEHRRRARLLSNDEFYITEKFFIKLYKSPCVGCGETKNITQDHVIPIARGGTHSEGNLQPMCKRCNSSKKDKLMSVWKYLR